MTSHYVSPEEALRKIFAEMEEKKLVSPEMAAKKETIISELANDFENNNIELTLHDLMRPEVQKRLIGAIISKTLGLKQQTENFIHTLKDDPEPELDEKLKYGLKLLKTLDKELLNKFLPPTPKPGSKIPDELQDDLKKDVKNDPEKQKQMTEELSLYEKQVTEALKNLYGGDDPRISGEIPSVIIGPIVGNLYGFTCQGPADPNSKALMIEQITYNPEKPDPLGLENYAKIIDEALGILTDDVAAEYRQKQYGMGYPK